MKPTKNDLVVAHLANDVRDDDRHLGIRSGGLVEASLEDLLRTRMMSYNSEVDESLFQAGGPFGSCASMIAAAYAFGLIDRPTRDHLNAIRLIRNRFAHDIFDVTFDDPSVKILCGKLAAFHQSGDPRTCFVKAANALHERFLTLAISETVPA